MGDVDCRACLASNRIPTRACRRTNAHGVANRGPVRDSRTAIVEAIRRAVRGYGAHACPETTSARTAALPSGLPCPTRVSEHRNVAPLPSSLRGQKRIHRLETNVIRDRVLPRRTQQRRHAQLRNVDRYARFRGIQPLRSSLKINGRR